MGKTFVGIGFGPIQSGLFLLEAQASGNFERLVVAEVVPEIVAAVRRTGHIRVNVAQRQGIRSQEIANVESYNPFDVGDVPRLVAAIAEADEIATALPSVDFYCRGKPSPAELLARGLERKRTDRSLPRTVIYAAENDNYAAEKLRGAVFAAIDSSDRIALDEHVQFLNTVIGKMCGVVSDASQIEQDGLATIVEGCNRAVLVEQFNRILVSQVTLADFERGIDVFLEKLVLLPFEEAKLYGHNAAHALLGYLAHVEQMEFIHEVNGTGLLRFVEQAFLEESGTALCRRHAAIDPLFDPNGWAQHARKLLERMVNPFLRDRVTRVIRDPRRKLGWNDRLIGTMRLAIEGNICPRRYALGAAAAAEMLAGMRNPRSVTDVLHSIWGNSADPLNHRHLIIDYIEQARKVLRSSAPT